MPDGQKNRKPSAYMAAIGHQSVEQQPEAITLPSSPTETPKYRNTEKPEEEEEVSLAEDEVFKEKISFYLPEAIIVQITEHLVPRYNLRHRRKTGKRINRNDLVWFLLEHIDEDEIMKAYIPHRRSPATPGRTEE